MELQKDPNLARHDKERKWISVFVLIAGIGLLFFKFYAYQVTHSQSIFSDALESIVNVVAGAITLVVIVVASRPADDDHPYGHGKVESMAASFEGGAITFAGLLIIIQAAEAFYRDVKIQELNLGLLIVILAGLANGVMGYFIYLRGKALHSDALRSSGVHLMTDALTSLGVITSLVLVRWTGLNWIDAVVAIALGLALCISGAKILIHSGNVLMDGQDLETLKLIAGLFEKNYKTGIIHIHYTRVIRSGRYHHIDCHVVIPEFWSVSESHIFSEDFERRFVQEYPFGAELKIHLDPCRMVYCENCELENCPIRQKNFVKRIPLDDLTEITSPIESR